MYLSQVRKPRRRETKDAARTVPADHAAKWQAGTWARVGLVQNLKDKGGGGEKGGGRRAGHTGDRGQARRRDASG